MQGDDLDAFALYDFVNARLSVAEDVQKSAEHAHFGGYPEDAIGILFTGVTSPLPRDLVELVENNLDLLDDGTGLPEKDFRRAVGTYGVDSA